MKKIMLVFSLFAVCNTLSAQTEKLSLDIGWHFYLGDIPMPIITGHEVTYSNAKAGKAWGAAAPDYDDKNWRLLNLPHDWAVEQPFDSTENISQGYRKRGIGWYRRNFKLDAKDRNKHIELQFDGIATNATVWFNGNVVHRNWCGYTSFYIDISAFAKYGDEVNNIAIRVDAVEQEGWWYEGAGIYRHTWLVKQNSIHIITDGVYANPIKQNKSEWLIPVEATIENSGKAKSSVDVETILYDNTGKEITSNKTKSTVYPLEQSIAKINLQVSNPNLWWVDDPTLYKVKTIIKQNGATIDEVTTNCGFRTIKFTADSGFYLNDVNMKIKGTCNHQDHAGVGVAVPNSIWEFRVRKLKEMGSNAYRCAHNPPSKEFLDACDKYGLLVMDENRHFNSSPEYVRQLEWMVRRDRNHPSIILWSVFNEEPMQATEIGYEMARRMSSVVKHFDTTRPVTAAMNGGQFTPLNVSKAVDVVGFNYKFPTYDKFHELRPNQPMTSSEDVSCLMQRDEYVTDTTKHTLQSYDEEKPEWGSTHREGWKAVAERPYVAGCFVWTGFDYHGEPTPYQWPTAGSNFGIMDQCGFPKAAFYLHQAQWITDKPILQLVPHWTWPTDSIGKKIKVMAFCNAEKIKLLLNGKTVGEQTVDKYEMNSWMVPYHPGKLEAIAYTKGKEVARFVVETTGEPANIELVADRNSITNDGWDAVPVAVRITDAQGRLIRTANIPIQFELNGAATIIGLGNGNANSHEPEKGNNRSTYNGLAQVILQSKANGNGQLTLTAKANGLKTATITIDVKEVEQIPTVAVNN
jgi:beta-galactosidase